MSYFPVSFHASKFLFYNIYGGSDGKKKNLPEMRPSQVWSQGWEDPLEKQMATHSSILAWGIPWTEKPDGLESRGSQSQKPLSN